MYLCMCARLVNYICELAKQWVSFQLSVWIFRGFATNINWLHISLSRLNRLSSVDETQIMHTFFSHHILYMLRPQYANFTPAISNSLLFLSYARCTFVLCRTFIHFHLQSHFNWLGNRKCHYAPHICSGLCIITMEILYISFIFVSRARSFALCKLRGHYVSKC